MHVQCTSSTHNSKIPPPPRSGEGAGGGYGYGVDSQEFLSGSGLCDLNPDPISDHSTLVFSRGLLIPVTFF